MILVIVYCCLILHMFMVQLVLDQRPKIVCNIESWRNLLSMKFCVARHTRGSGERSPRMETFVEKRGKCLTGTGISDDFWGHSWEAPWKSWMKIWWLTLNEPAFLSNTGNRWWLTLKKQFNRWEQSVEINLLRKCWGKFPIHVYILYNIINHDYNIDIIILVHNNIRLECETSWNFEVQGQPPPQEKCSDGANLWLWRNPEEGVFL